MPKYRITTVLPDGMAQAPPFEVSINNHGLAEDGSFLDEIVEGEFYNDYGDQFSVGTTVTVERIA